jgi:CHAT domain-containing protein
MFQHYMITSKLKFFVFAIYLFLASCANHSPFVDAGHKSANGDHHSGTQLFETIGGYKVWDNHHGLRDAVYLERICSAYFELRSFNKAIECINNWRELAYKNDLEHRNYIHSAFMSAVYLDLGKIEDAYKSSKDSFNYIKKVGVKGLNSWDYYESHGEFSKRNILVYKVLGISASELGNISIAKEAMKFLEAQYLVETRIWKKKAIKTSLVQIALAVGDVKQAKLFLANDDVSGLQKFNRALNAVTTLGYTEVFATVPKDFFSAHENYLKAKICILESDLKCAKSYYDSILEFQKKFFFEYAPSNEEISEQKGLYYTVLYERGLVSKLENDFESALKFIIKSINLIEFQRSSIIDDTSKIGYAGGKSAVYESAIEIFNIQGSVRKAFEYAERAKSRALVDTLASKKQFGKSETNSSNKLLAELDQAEYESLQLVSSTSRTRSIEIQKSIEATDKQLSSLVSVKSTTVAEIQSKLKKNEVLVEYYGNDENYFIFVLTKNSIKSVKIDSSKLENLVTNYRATLSTRNSKKYKSASKALYDEVIKPVKHLIKGKKLTIVPHGSLHYVPFASLWDGKRYLVQKYQIRTLPSASVLEFLQDKVVNKAGELLVLGNPDLGNPDYDLPGAQDEAVRLAKANKGSKVLLRKNASETALKKYGSSFKNIHFAMHGIFEAEKPLTSGLLLAPDSENDGRLTVSELYDLDLNADLVTLSACETALGETKSGDDVIGFTRGFLYAGANSIVSSLWEVDDIATRDLMLRFYKELKSNNKARALQKAQLRVMKKYPHPYYWAAFQLTGQY